MKNGRMAVLRIYLMCFLDFHLIFAVYSCPSNEFTAVDASGKEISCRKCVPCPPGYGLFPQCGSRIKQTDMIGCQPCELGRTYSTVTDIGSCQPCQICSKHQTVVKNCTLESNSKCNDTCTRGFYFEELTGDCQKCSWCCEDGSNDVRHDCKDMPSYQQCDANTNMDCKPKCKEDQYIAVAKKGGRCEDCKDCPPGTAPFPRCGGTVENIADVKCLKCVAGETFSDEQGKSPCKSCSKCTIGQRELIPCNLTNDRVCGECDKGFYKDDSSNECKPCSACCNDDKDVHIQKCAEQNMPKNIQCSYTKRAISVCQQERNTRTSPQQSKNSLVVFIAAGVAVGLVTSVLAMLYWRLKYRRYKRLSRSSRQPSLALLLPSTEEAVNQPRTLEDPTVDGLQETLSFEKAGVLLQFIDPDSFYNEAREIKVEICWDTSVLETLRDNEVQLSPVIKFHPYGLKLSRPVLVRIPHSALVFYTHGWNIQLKSYISQNGTVVWRNEDIDEIGNNEVSFHVDCLLSYVVVGTSVYNSKPTKKRFQCAVFGGDGKVGENFTVYLYVFDDSEASLEKIMQEEKSKNRILLGSLQSLYAESVLDSDIKIAIPQPVEGWNVAHINPQVITSKNLKESYHTIPRSEILFEHDNGQNRDFLCNFELSADNTTTKICAVASIKEDPFRRYQESRSGLGRNHQMVTGRNLCDPLITNEDSPSPCFHELPKEVLHAVCMKLDLSYRGVGSWRHVAANLGFTDKEIEVFREEMLTPDGSPCTVMLQALKAKSPKLTVAEFVQILQIRKIQRFDVVDVLEPYVYDSSDET